VNEAVSREEEMAKKYEPRPSKFVVNKSESKKRRETAKY
jgi:hypothetical protein